MLPRKSASKNPLPWPIAFFCVSFCAWKFGRHAAHRALPRVGRRVGERVEDGRVAARRDDAIDIDAGGAVALEAAKSRRRALDAQPAPAHLRLEKGEV